MFVRKISMPRRTLNHKMRQGFTLVELLIVIAIVIILLALLIPTVGTAMAGRRTTQCENNLKQLAAGIFLHQDAAGRIDATNWTTTILASINESGSSQLDDLLVCPEGIASGQLSSYGMANMAHRYGDEDSGRIVLLDYNKTIANLVVDKVKDQDPWSEDSPTYAARHLARMNVLLQNGGVKSYAAEDIDPRECELWDRYWRPYRERYRVLEGCGTTDSPPTNPPPEPSDSPPTNPPPNYDPLDPTQCTSEETTVDDAGGSVTTAHDGVSYTIPAYLVNYYQQFGLPIPPEAGFFREPTVQEPIPPDSVGEPWGSLYLMAEGFQTEGTRAIFEFDVEPGNYHVWAYWIGSSKHAASAPVQILDGDSPVSGGVFTVNQERSSEQYAADQGQTPLMLKDADGYSKGWYKLGPAPHQITGTQLKVVFSANAGAANATAGAQEFVVADAVRIACADEQAYHADRCQDEKPDPVDDAQATATVAWQTESAADAYEGSHHWASGESQGSETVTFNLPELIPGQYRVWTYFVPDSDQATNAPFTVYDGNKQYGTVLVDQSKAYTGADLDGDGRLWYLVGEYEIRRRTGVHVKVSNNANGKVVADAVRFECSFASYGTGPSDCDQYNPLYGRECKQYYAEDYGASQASEEAVANALGWISRHQYSGGYWSFDFTAATCPYIDAPEPCESQCDYVGSYADKRVAATGMALLPYLGAGFGPTHADYGEVVARGINYLISEIDSNGILITGQDSISKQGYEHAIASIAVVEALGICRQTGFGDVDQAALYNAAISVVSRAVGCKGPNGGWGYVCGSEDDTTVTAWAYQALMAARAVAIDFESMAAPDGATADVVRFLDFVQTDMVDGLGSQYYYGQMKGMMPARMYFAEDSSRSSGPFLRLNTGTPTSHPAMQAAAGLELDRISGGMVAESYRNYYAHHFMKDMGGTYWSTWDDAMATYLLETNPQPTEGHVRGSWQIGGVTLAAPCARLWDTVLGCMVLEAYYRYSQSL